MLSRSDLPAFGVRWVCTRNHVTLCEARQSVCGFQGGDLGLHEKSCCALRGATVRAWLPRWYCHQRVYMRVQGTMANFTGGPVYNPDRASLPLAHQIGLGPHVSGYGPLPGGVRALATLHPGMCVQAQKTIIGVVKTLWKRASPNDCVEVGLLCWGDAGSR